MAPDPHAGAQPRPANHWLILLLLLALGLGLVYLVFVPPWQAPDETGHFEYAWLIARLGRLPSPEDVQPQFEQELLASLYEWRYGEFIRRPLPEGMPARLEDLPPEIFARRSRVVQSGRFSLAYLWQALFLLPIRHQDLAVQLYVVRFSSLLLNLAIVWLAFRTFSELVIGRPYLVVAMTAVIVLLPQHSFINSTVGDGPLAELFSVLVLYGWVRLFQRGFHLWAVLGIVLGTLAAISTKTTAVFLAPLDLGLVLWWLIRQRRRPWTRRQVVALSAGAALLAVAGWAWLRSPLGYLTETAIRDSLSGNALLWMDQRGMTFGQALLASHDSFWANFGWMVLPVSGRWYGAALLLTALGAGGWLFGRDTQACFPSWAPKLMAAAFFLALGISVWVALLAGSSQYYQFQGRYLFPAVVPFAFLLVGGWVQAGPSLRPSILVAAGLVFLVLLNVWSVVAYIVPYYHS
jgi:hypothetical protein